MIRAARRGKQLVSFLQTTDPLPKYTPGLMHLGEAGHVVCSSVLGLWISLLFYSCFVGRFQHRSTVLRTHFMSASQVLHVGGQAFIEQHSVAYQSCAASSHMQIRDERSQTFQSRAQHHRRQAHEMAAPSLLASRNGRGDCKVVTDQA